MSRRLEIELTSKREDGSYSWRAAGAKQPKGSLDGALLYDGAAVGDVVRADADFAVDGVTIVSVLPPKAKRKEPEKLEILGSGKDEGGVTTQLVKGRKGDRGDRGGRGGRDGGGRGRGRDNRGGRDGRDNRGGRDGRTGGDRSRSDRDDRGGRGQNSRGDNRGGPRDGRGRDGRSQGSDRPRSDRPRRDRSQNNRPKPKRLRPRRTHRDAVLREIPEIQRPLAKVVLRDGVPGVRSLVEKQNAVAKKAEQPEIPPKMLEAVGEKLLPQLRAAEWRDNAEAALAGVHEVDLRDLRKVVVAAENGAKDDESRALAEQLKTGLTQRVDAEHGKWLSELNTLLNDGRTVRALRQSSRPPKAGSPLPADLAGRLVEGANSSMTADTAAERWATVLDAVAFSPVRQQVQPQGLPNNVTDQLKATVKKLSKRVPHIAAMFTPAKPATPAAPAPIPAPPSLGEETSPAPTEPEEPPAAATTSSDESE